MKVEPVRILIGDVLDGLAKLPDGSVHCCVTSPPYWGLRDYGVDGQIGLEPTPDAFVEKMVTVFRQVRRVLREDGTLWLNIGDSYCSTDKWGGGTNGNTGKHRVADDGSVASWAVRTKKEPVPGLKPKDLCGIPWRVALALQQPYYTGRIKKEADRIWLAAIVDGEGSIFIHRQPAGTPTGRNGTPRTQDNFCAGVSICNCSEQIMRRVAEMFGNGSFKRVPPADKRRGYYTCRITGNKAKALLTEIYPHLVGKQQEARIAIACPPSGNVAASYWSALKQLHKEGSTSVDSEAPNASSLWEPGWYLRSVIVWAKKSPMPESVTDRPTSSWEPIFLMSKSERYFYDAEAVKEPLAWPNDQRPPVGTLDGNERPSRGGRMPPIGGVKHAAGNGNPTYSGDRPAWPSGRNQRNVWTLSSEPYKEAHFATYPTEIPRRAIKAGTSEKGCCPKCGAGWQRVIERDRVATRSGKTSKVYVDPEGSPYEQHSGAIVGNRDPFRHCTTSATVGWEPTCKCDGIDRRPILTPTGERVGMTRYEQAKYAAQLRVSPHRAAMATEAGTAFDHYIRTDESGARAIPPELHESWISRGWLDRVTVPESTPPTPVPCVVLDPFLGSGTTVAVARELGRYGVGCELNPEYAELARERIGRTEKPLTFQSNRVVDSPLFVQETT